jgi:hypothetical protein
MERAMAIARFGLPQQAFAFVAAGITKNVPDLSALLADMRAFVILV